MGKEWPCEHISPSGSLGPYDKNWVYGTGNNIIMIHQSEMFCRYCGTPRPSEPKKGLAERLRDAHAFYHDKNSPVYLRQADAAKEWFLGVVESMNPPRSATYSTAVNFKDELIKKLKEEGEG